MKKINEFGWALILVLVLTSVLKGRTEVEAFQGVDEPTRGQAPTALPPAAVPLCLGGDTIGAAVPIQIGGPYSGFTTGFSNDYDIIIDLEQDGGSPDVVYSLTLTQQHSLRFDLCSADFDARLYLLEQDGVTVRSVADTGCQTNPLAPQLLVAAMSPGVYYLVVDGSNGESGLYGLYLTQWLECEETLCPQGTQGEMEPNSGCDYPNPQFTSIYPGSVVCGELWAGSGTRDTDWFRLSLPQPTQLSLQLAADEVDPVLILLEASEDNCYGSTVLELDEAGFCETEMIETDWLPAGEYLIFIAHHSWQEDIAGHYELQVIAEFGVPTLVELISFDANASSDHVQLSWETSGEQAVPYYIVARDGTVVAQLPVEATHYQVVDYEVETGARYNYVLQAVNYNGEVEVLSSRSVTIPAVLELRQNYPNPFNPLTRISFQLACGTQVRLTVYTATGTQVSTICDGYLTGGEYNMEFDGSDLPSGAYFYTLQAEGSTLTRKMLLLK
ncbi:MAG: T9SS type A sorting domain-containing protein [Candidatus Delongbacteria bacterium]|nr:T9SS type A sorting domain-containing protein [Candidatus Delongbacteria bacterium]